MVVISTGVEVDAWTVDEINSFYRQNKIIFNPEYQRGKAWDDKKRSRLLDSIFREYPIGLLMAVPKNSKFEIIDGQQRISSITQFMRKGSNLKVSATEEGDIEEFFSKKLFSQLTKSQKNKFTTKVIPICFLTFDENKVGQIFLRLQGGVNPNTAEQLNAIQGDLKKQLIKIITKHENGRRLFNRIGISAWRFKYRFILAQIALIEKDGDYENGRMPSLRRRDLIELYTGNTPNRLPQKINSVITFIEKSLGNRVSGIHKDTDFICLYFLASILHSNFVINKNVKKYYSEFVSRFLNKINTIQIGNPKDVNELPKEEIPYGEYKISQSKGAYSGELLKRFRIIHSLFFSKYPKLELKDRKRLFTEEQKVAIYFKAGGKCQYKSCPKTKESMNQKDANYHHIKFHSKGGSTIVKNGMLVHKKCHQKIHSKKIDDDI